jgi:hypothetical protein
MVAEFGVELSHQAPMRPFIRRALGALDLLYPELLLGALSGIQRRQLAEPPCTVVASLALDGQLRWNPIADGECREAA